MPGKTNTPNPQLSFFSNMFAHFKITHKRDTLDKLTTGPLTPIRDKYDYIDEVCASIAMPVVIAELALFITSYSAMSLEKLVEAKLNCHKIENKETYLEDLKEDYMDMAQDMKMYFLTAGYIYLKALISLFTRPVVTAVNGFKAKDENDDRFAYY